MSSGEPVRKSSPARLHRRLRYPPSLSVKYEGHDEEIRVFGPNISSQGMFINTPSRFPEGTVLKVTFALPITRFKVTVRCEVRYCLPGVGLGVEFIDLSSKAYRAIEREMKAHREDEAG